VALADIRYLADATLPVEQRERVGYVPVRDKRNCFAELRVPLAAYGFESGNSHSGLLHLIDGPSRLDGVVLAPVADENDALDAGIARFA
jgi:hypothetical protein